MQQDLSKQKELLHSLEEDKNELLKSLEEEKKQLIGMLIIFLRMPSHVSLVHSNFYYITIII
jgi:hypothetical protein